MGSVNFALFLLLAAATAQPHRTPLRYDEDWSPLCKAQAKHTGPDRIKCVSLGSDGRYLSFGLDVRFKYEHYFNKSFDPNPGSDGYLLQRYLPSAELVDRRVRVFVQAEHSAYSGAVAPTDLTWRNDLAATDAFVEYAFGGSSASYRTPALLDVGRYQLSFGSNRMVDNRIGLNTLQAFDGTQLRLTDGHWKTDAFWGHPVTVSPLAFDDRPDRTRSFFGIYASRPLATNTVDLYALGDQRDVQPYYRGTGPETRYTFGARYATSAHGFDTDSEADWQTGRFSGAQIEAFAVEASAGYSWGAGRNRFRFGVGGGVQSGDQNPKSSLFELFRAPYPTGLTFGIIQANAGTDTQGFTLDQSWNYDKRVTLALAQHFYYRQSPFDGLYIPAGVPFHAPGQTQARPIGDLDFVSVAYVIDPHATLITSYARYFVGAYLRAVPVAPGIPSASTSYFGSSLEYTI